MPYYGPGMPWHDRRVAQEKARLEGDLEANISPATSLTDSPTAASSNNTDVQARSQYSRSGRGGAGNYSSPDGKMGGADATQAVDATSVRIREDERSVSRTYGRGGVGNYVAGIAEDEENARSTGAMLEQKRAKLQLDIEKDVEAAVAMPEKAKLPLSSPRDVKTPGYPR